MSWDPQEVTDYVHGAESDSGYYVSVGCPRCGDAHFVTASSIGWFLFECGGAVVSGRVEGWRERRVVVVRKGGQA